MLEQVWPQLVVRVFLACLTPFTVQVQNGAVSVQGRMFTLGTVLAGRELLGREPKSGSVARKVAWLWFLAEWRLWPQGYQLRVSSL